MNFFRLGLLRDVETPSLSPLIFNWAFARAGVQGEYRLFNVPEAELERFVRRGEWDGLNVTVPYKTRVYDLCDRVTPRAERAVAVNTIYRRDGLLWGDNTDIPGFREALLRAAPRDANLSHVLLIGTGGAARAVLVALGESLLAADVSIATRDADGASLRLDGYAPLFSALRYLTLSDAARDLDRFDLVVQATPVGGARIPGLPLPGPLRFKRGALAIDLIYNPPVTLFLRDAQESGAWAENGLVMLLAQAGASFEVWTDTPFPLHTALRELLPQLRRL